MARHYRFNRGIGLFEKRARAFSRRSAPLLWPTLAFLMGQGIASLAGSWLLCAVGLAAIGGGMACFTGGRRLRRGLLSVACLLGGGAAAAGVASTPPDASGVHESGTTTVFLGRVDQQPRYPRSGEIRLSLRVLERWDDGQPVTPQRGRALAQPARVLCRAIYLPWRNVSRAESGSYLLFLGTFQRLRRDPPWSYDGQLAAQGYSAKCKIRYAAVVAERPNLFQRVRTWLTSPAIRILGNNEKSGILLSMAIGERDAISMRTEDAFRLSGLSHVLVVSGYHVGIVFWSLRSLLRILLITLLPALSARHPLSFLADLLACCAATGFGALCGLERPTLRAVIAIWVFLLARLAGRKMPFLHGICFALLLMSAWEPFAIFDPGVQFTLAALFGICVASCRMRPREPIVNYLRVCWCASLFTWLPVAVWSDVFPLLGPLWNILLAPALTFCTCQGGLTALILTASGLDPYGVLLQLIGFVVELARDLLVAAAGFGAIEISSASSRVAICALIALLISREAFKAYGEYLRRNGIWPSTTREQEAPAGPASVS